MSLETRFAALYRDAVERLHPPGTPSTFSCPACGGVLWEIDDGLLRFRCRVGHAYTADGAVDAQGEAVDEALWAAMRALLERAELMQRLARRDRGHRGKNAVRFDEQAREALDQADLIRTALLERDGRDT